VAIGVAAAAARPDHKIVTTGVCGMIRGFGIRGGGR
jgi:hypothetical protein